MSNRNFHIVSSKAQRERKYAIAPRQKEPPHGDFPWDYTPKPHPKDHDYIYLSVTVFGGLMIVGIVAFLLDAIFAWPL